MLELETVTNVHSLPVPKGEGSDKDKRVLSSQDQPVQKATGQLPDPPECYAKVTK